MVNNIDKLVGRMTPEQMEEVSRIHRAWGKAIQEAADLITLWELEENDELMTPPRTKNVTPEKE